MLTNPLKNQFKRQLRHQFGEPGSPAPAAHSSRNFLLAFDSVSGPAGGFLFRPRRVSRKLRRGVRIVLALAALLALFSWARAARGQTGYQFSPAVAVGATSGPDAVTLTVQSAGTLSAIQVLTAGAPGLDFASSGGGSCSAGTAYSAGQSCTVTVAFTASFPGQRSGAVVLTDTNGNPMATAYLTGIGVGPLSVATAGEITTVAGNGHLTTGTTTGSKAVDAVIHEPVGTAVDGAGNVYYTDSGNNLIGKVDLNGNLTIVAGTGTSGFSPNGTPAASAMLNSPSAMLLDGAGNVFFADSGNSAVREIVAATGLIETVAGTGSVGYSGDGGAATAATLNHPQGIALDTNGNLYIADTGNNVIREVSAANGTIATIAGTGVGGFGGDGGPAAAALLNQPWGISFGMDGSLYIADFLNNVIRRIDTSGNISTVAGTGDANYSGDLGPALSATLDHPASVVLDAANDLFIADSENNVVRKVNGVSQIITTLAANGSSDSNGDGLDANTATVAMNKVYGLCLDPSGDLFIADRLGLRVREIYAALARIQFPDIKVTNTSPATVQEIDNDGNAPLHIASITPVSNAAVDPATTTCSTTSAMAPGAACNIGVEFKPEVVGAPVNGQINVASDSANSPVVIDLFGNSLSIEPTTTAVTSSVNPSALGQAVTFTATVSSQSSTLTGTVQFMDGTTVLGGVPVLLSSTTRTAKFTTTSLALGSHAITAVYSGDNLNATSTSPVLTQIVKQTSVLLLTSSENPAQVYDAVTFTVAVSETPSGGVAPAGAIVFSADGSLLPNGTIAIANGTASYTTSLLAAGSHAITAAYAGDANNMPGTSNTLTEVVNAATTTTLLTSSNASVTLTAPVTFTATVVGNNSSTPTGNVVFKDGTAAIGTSAMNNAGVASFTTSTLGTGSHSITAAYQGDQDYAASVSAPLTETVNKIATATAVVSSANPANAGAAVRFTVTVTAASATTPNVPLTGSVTLMDGASAVGTGTLAPTGTGPATASAVISISTLAIGSHAITAIYGGDANYLASTSGATAQTVSQATSSNLLTASTTAPVATKPVTLTATLSSNGGTPTGTVTFLDTGTAIGTGNLANGIASITTATLAVGPHTITAVYGGDANDSASTSNAVTVTVQSATTKVALTPSQSPTNFGQPFTLTAAVTGNGGVPAGSVTFSDGGTPLQTVTLANGTAAYTTSALAVGGHTFTASYGGDANDTASSSAPLTVQVLETVTIVLTSPSPNPSVARSNVHFVATITAQQGIQPTGSVTFFDNGVTPLGTEPINGNTATFDTAALTVGTHQIIASYAGDGSTAATNSAPYTQVVNAAGVTVTLTSSANPATFGSLLTFTATAAGSNGSLTGTVKFEDGGATIGSAALSSTGVASFSTSTLGTGVHQIVAAYQGDANDQPASSSVLQQVVERTTSITLTSSQNPMLTLAPVTITAAVANGPNAAGGSEITAAPTGTITFAQDGVVVSTLPVSSSGTAALQVASLPAGTHTFVATYSGDATDLASASTPLNEVVQLRATTDALTTSASSLTGGQQLTLISVVKWNGATTPTGSVTFFNGTSSLATAAVDPTGVATVTVLLSGTSANLSSSYSGDASYAPSTSGTDLVTIGPAADFSMSAQPPVFTVASKQHEIVTLTIGSMKNFTDTLSLGCLGLPKAATCSFSSDQMVLGAGSIQTVTLTVDTGDPLLAGTQAKNEGPSSLNGQAPQLVLACLLPGGLLLGLLGIRFRKVRGIGGLLFLLLLAALSTAVIGCGTVSQIGTPAGVYNFDVTATGKTGVTETLPLTMTVTQ